MNKKRLSTIILILIFVAGLSLLLYPSVSDYWNSTRQSKAIASYVDTVDNMYQETIDQIKENARIFNKKLFERNKGLYLNDTEKEEYNAQLDVSGSGIMSYIIIDKIHVELPVYHGTEDSVLQVGIGHIEGSSLPVGGESTHCVLSGHRGLPSAKLFSNLDKLEVGDTFILDTLDETLTYEVDKISIVLPDELDELAIFEGEDLCTLVTCTPYGINTHRLLVRGHRIENDEKADIRVVSEATRIQTLIIAPIFAAPMLLILLIWMLFSTRKNKRKAKAAVNGNNGNNENNIDNNSDNNSVSDNASDNASEKQMTEATDSNESKKGEISNEDKGDDKNES